MNKYSQVEKVDLGNGKELVLSIHDRRREAHAKRKQRMRTMKRRRFVATIGLFVAMLGSFAFALSQTEPQPEPIQESPAQIFYSKDEGIFWVEYEESLVKRYLSVEMDRKKEESSIYNPDIPMPKEHQEYLYQLCEERGLDYIKTLAVLKHESQFDPNAIGATNDYGYMQVNKGNHRFLSQTLGTPNTPLDPYVNLNWGTYMLADAYRYWESQGITGRRLDEYALSTYNKGINGFKNHGKAERYIARVDVELAYLTKVFE